jgi:hypothetical protein
MTLQTVAVEAWRPAGYDWPPYPSKWVSDRLFLGRLLPSRARFRFTGRRHHSSIPIRRGSPTPPLNRLVPVSLNGRRPGLGNILE